MFWLIMLAVGVGVFVFSFGFFDDEVGGFFCIGGICVFFVSLLILFILVITGIGVYPQLKGDLKKIEVYQSRLVDIRNAQYRTVNKKGATLISGSIENANQSTILSKYIATLSEMEAEYNSRVEINKLYLQEWPLWFFRSGFFISEKVLELPFLEIKNYKWGRR